MVICKALLISRQYTTTNVFGMHLSHGSYDILCVSVTFVVCHNLLTKGLK